MQYDTVNSDTPRPWGAWATIGFSALILVVFLILQVMAGIVAGVIMTISNPDIRAEELGSNGMLLGIITCLTAPVLILLCVIAAALRRNITLKDYFALHWPGFKSVALWTGLILLYGIAYDTIAFFAGRPIVPDFVRDAYQTATVPIVLWLATCVAAPAWEECMFRGFVFAGLRRSRLGALGTIIVASLIWSLMHLQYDIYDIASVFFGGIILGYAREKTGSLWTPVIMHAVWGIVATTEAHIFTHYM